MKTKCHGQMPVRLGPEWDFSLWLALQEGLPGTRFVSSRIREQFANIQSVCTKRNRAASVLLLLQVQLPIATARPHLLGVPSLSYLKRGIERRHLGMTARYSRRVLELRWYTIS